MKNYLTEVVLLTKSYNLQDFKDWMHWHLDVIGFDRCKIFDNESLVDIKSVCDKYGDRVSYELVKGWPDQYNLYDRYINNESQAWWVLPIDDDEYLYVSDKYKNNVNEFIKQWLNGMPNIYSGWFKICVGWRNMFPEKHIEKRQSEHRIENATAWSDRASMVWQAGNLPVKTFVHTSRKYEWSDRLSHSTHDPLVDGKYSPGHTSNMKPVERSWQITPTESDSDLILYHYQFVSEEEWQYKCKNRKSPGAKNFLKDFPTKYRDLYNYKSEIDTRILNLWKSNSNF